MAKDKKMVEAITSMEEDFAQWYTDVVKKAELCDYASVKGCMVIKPDGYAIWENIQNELDKRFKATGVRNVYMPSLQKCGSKYAHILTLTVVFSIISLNEIIIYPINLVR